MLGFIIKTISIYKMFKFYERGNIELNINKSRLIFTPQGDIEISAGRHIIYNRELSFDGCDPEFVEKTIASIEENNKEQIKVQKTLITR